MYFIARGNIVFCIAKITRNYINTIILNNNKTWITGSIISRERRERDVFYLWTLLFAEVT